MRIKGSSERSVRAVKRLEEIDLKAQRSLNDSEGSSPTLPNSISAQGMSKMLTTPRSSMTDVHGDEDVDDLLAKGKAAADAAINHKAASSAPCVTQPPAPDAKKPVKSIEWEKYTVDDIDDWLVLTGFCEDEYRQKTLARHRRLKAIEEEKQHLLREEQEELQKYRVGFETSPMAPTLSAPEPTPGPELSFKQDKSSYSPPPAHIAPLEVRIDTQKRSRDETKDDIPEHQPPSKVPRRQSLERFQIEPLKHTPPRGPLAQTFKQRSPQQIGSNISHRFTRPDLFEDYNAPHMSQQAPDTRYFHIRSWNHENVKAAQQDCIWVTQKTNERTFIDAFEKSRRVILFFSVNNSKAFQGVAEMGSTPGAAGLPNPLWKTKLHWPATDAFGLIWLLKHDVPHHTVRHLTNSFNENLPAHVGIDGAEIETGVGEQMYSILDNYVRRGYGCRWRK